VSDFATFLRKVATNIYCGTLEGKVMGDAADYLEHADNKWREQVGYIRELEAEVKRLQELLEGRQ
jgi:hypothetical protein